MITCQIFFLPIFDYDTQGIGHWVITILQMNYNYIQLHSLHFINLAINLKCNFVLMSFWLFTWILNIMSYLNNFKLMFENVSLIKKKNNGSSYMYPTLRHDYACILHYKNSHRRTGIFSFRGGGGGDLTSLARRFSPALARKSSGYVRISPVFCPKMAMGVVLASFTRANMLYFKKILNYQALVPNKAAGFIAGSMTQDWRTSQSNYFMNG